MVIDTRMGWMITKDHENAGALMDAPCISIGTDYQDLAQRCLPIVPGTGQPRGLECSDRSHCLNLGCNEVSAQVAGYEQHSMHVRYLSNSSHVLLFIFFHGCIVHEFPHFINT